MKKITLLFVAVTFIFTAFAKKEKMERGEEMEYKRNNRSCQIKAKFKVSKYANIVFDNYQKLVSNNASNCKSNNGTMCSFGVIAYPANNGVPVYNYPFTSFVMGDKFRTVFSGEASAYSFYNVCVAPNLVPLPNPIYENHI